MGGSVSPRLPHGAWMLQSKLWDQVAWVLTLLVPTSLRAFGKVFTLSKPQSLSSGKWEQY